MSLGILIQGHFPEIREASDPEKEGVYKGFIETLDHWFGNLEGWKKKAMNFGKVSVITAEAHPGIESIQLHVFPSGSVMFKARTTPVGPGYHQHVVDLLDKLTEQFSFQWDNVEKADGTGFFQHRDVQKLEDIFTQWLKGFAQFLLDNPKDECVSMDLPHGIRVEAGNFIATTLGPRDSAWLKDIQQNPAGNVLDFFPWWSEGKDVLYYQGVALTLGWNLVAWRSPQTPREKEIMEAFVDACHQAASLDAAIELPRQAWVRCCQWLERDAPPFDCDNDPIGELGYRHGLIHFPLGGRWHLRLSGNFSQERLKEPGSWVAWENNRRVEARLLPLDKPAPVEDVLIRFKKKSEGQRITVRQEQLGFYGVADLGTTQDGQTILQAEYLCGDSVLAIQVIGGEDDSEWVLSVWESVRRDAA